MRLIAWKTRRIELFLVAAASMALTARSAHAQTALPDRAPPSVPKTEQTPTPPIPVPAPTAAPAVPEAAQPESPYDSADLGGSLSTFDSAVGYIDDAIPSNMFRLRFDAAWRDNRATRAEYFYAKGGPGGPGLARVEPNDDYQELSAYLEGKVAPNLSVFIDAPVRFINPEVNSNHAGFSDLNTGFKWAFLSEQDCVASFQTRIYIPTGNARLGLGTRHVSIEPALLGYSRLSDQLRLESELRLWVPVGGTDFAGTVVRYGIGFSYGERPRDAWWITPVVEVVGWTVLDGKEQVAFAPPPQVEDASGDTIVNLKVGLRIGLGDQFDVYSGYGRALTGEVWYKDIWRTELRFSF